MKIEKAYELLTSLGFVLLFVGLPLSKFLVTVGVSMLGVSFFLKIVIPQKFISSYIIKTYTLLIVTYLILLISIIWSDNRALGIKEIITQNGIATIPILVAVHWERFRSHIHSYIRYLLYAVVVACMTTLIFYSLPPEVASEWASRLSFLQDYHTLQSKTQFGLYSPFIDRLHFAYIIGFVIFYCIYMYVLDSGKFYLAIGLIGLITLILLGARGAHLAFLLGGIIYIGYIHQHRMGEERVRWIYLPIAGIVAGLLSFLAFKTIPAVSNRYNQTLWEIEQIRNDTYKEHNFKYFSTLTRLKSIENTWDVITVSPFLGVGIGDLEAELNKKYEDTPEIPVHNQNYYLYLWATGGLIPLITFVVFIIGWSRHYIEKGKPMISGFAFAYALFLGVILTIDVILKYHIGVFSIPIFLLSISALHYNDSLL